MSSKRKSLRYSQKRLDRLDYKREESATLRMKVLRSVLAVGVGFALTPWLGRQALAGDSNTLAAGTIVRTGQTENLIASGTAHIYAEKASNGVGLNAFEHFSVGNNQIANMYFQKEGSTEVLNTLVNTVNDRISIYGTVNALRNNKIGGKMYFLSDKGMVVGSSGVINAGALTVITSGNTFTSAEAAAQAITDNSWSLDSTASIDIHGRINTATGIDLRAAYINVTKANGSDITPVLKTGVMFDTTVNTEGLVTDVSVKNERLTASLDSKGNIIIADPSNPTGAQGDAAVKGDGSIKLAAYSDSKNAKTEFLGISSITNTVEAKVEVGEGATLDARGNVEISAEAKRLQRTKITEFWDMVAFTKADTTVNGSVTGADVKIAATASSEYSGGNYANVLDMLNDGMQETGVIGLKSKFSSYLLGLVESNPHWGQGGMLTNNIIHQLYMPFAITDAKATTNIGANAQIIANVLKNGAVAPTYTKDNVAHTVGGNMNITANSKTKNKMKVGLQPRIQEGSADFSKYFTGGFIYQNSSSKATVNVDGKLQSEKNMNIAAEAKNTNSGSMSVLTPKYYDQGVHGDKYASMFMVGVGLSYQDTEATVNLGSAALADKGSKTNPLLNAGGNLDVKANSTNEMDSDVSVGSDITAGSETDDTAVSTAVNLVTSKGTATVNDYVAVKGDSVNMEASHALDSLSISTCDEYVGEFTGLSWVINNEDVAEKADALKPWLKKLGLGNQMPDNPGAAGGGGGGGAAGGGANVTDWNQYFDLGASVAVAEVTNEAKLNVYPVASAEATGGDLNLNAAVEIADTSYATTNLLMNSSDTTYVTAAAAVGVEYMENTAEVNINLKDATSQDSNNTELKAVGDVNITSNVEQRYNRVNSMCDDLVEAWKSFLKHYTDWSKPGVKDKLDKLQSIVVDILWLREKEKTVSYKDSKKFGKKASAAIDLIGSLTGTNELREALLAFLEPSNYVNMYVSAGAKNNDADKQKDVTAVVTGTVGVQNLHNTANVNIGANTLITAGKQNAANIAANVVETNVMAVGKLSAFPYFIIDPTPLANAKNGLGGTVGVQNAYNNSRVQVMNGVNIDAGSIDIATKNDVLNIGIGIAGSQTSKLGLTGMVSYMGGESHAETLVDDDVSFTARKKVERVTEKDEDDRDIQVDKVTSTGAVNISSTNDTNIINLVGDWNSSETSSVGASVGVISYDIHSIAELTNQELNNDGTSAETSATANHKGNISANSVNVNAFTDGTINTFTVAGVKNSSENANQQAGGANAAAGGGAGAIAGGVQNANINGGNAGGQPASISLNAVGSVSWNYVVDETKATLDNVNIDLTKADVAADVTDETLKKDISASVKVEAEDASYIGAYSGAMALNKLGNGDNSKFQGTLAGAVGVNDLKKTTTATLQNTAITRVTTDVGVDVLNYAHNSGAQVATGLSLGLETGKRSGGIAINLAASGSANYIDSTVHADMLNDAIVGRNTVVNNVAYDQDVQVAGGVTTQVTKSTASAGAAVTVNDVKNDIKALMNNNTIGVAAIKAAEVHNIAASKLTQVGTAISVGVATGDKSYAALNVAVAKNNVDNTVDATIDGGAIYANKVSNEAKDGKLTASTADNKYLTELNQTSSFAVSVDAQGNFVTGAGNQQQILAKDITVDQDGNFCKNGQILTPSVEIKDDGYYQGNVQLQANITKDADGNYYDINNQPITLDEKDGLYHDINGEIVDVEDVRYFNPTTHEEVDVANVVYTDPSGKIVDIYDITYKDRDGNAVNPNELKTTTNNFYDFTGNDALNQANGTNTADPTNTKGADLSVIINDNADKATYNSSKITLSNQGNTIVGVALGLGVVTGEGGSVSGAAAAAANVNTVTNNFTATVKNATIGTGVSSYEDSGELKEAALRVEAASDTRMVSVAAGAAANAKSQGVSIAVAGSGAYQGVNNTTKASVENSTISTDYLALNSTTESSLVSVAGQVSVETSQKGVAAGLTWAENNMNNTTGAYAQGITLNGINGAETNLALAAENKAKTWAVAVGASVSLGNGAAEGAYAENSGKNNTEAIVDKYETKNEQGSVTYTRDNTINNAKNISVTAKDTTVEKGIAGTIAVAAGQNAMASIGGAVVYNNIGNGAADNQKQTVKAQLNYAAITTASGASIKTKATNEADFLGLALGGSVRAGGEKFGVSAEGSVAVTTDYMNTIAGMENVNIDQSSGSQNSKVEVEANSTSDITSSADALSVSVGDGIKISGNAAVSKVRSDADTTTEIKNSIIKAQDVIAKANSTNEILDVAIGLNAAVGGGSASIGLAGNVATNRIDNDTTVTLANDNLYATGTVAALSDSYERLRNYGGAISIGVSSQAGVALGATVVTNTIEGDTESIVKDSYIVALGGGDGVKVNEHAIGAVIGDADKYELKENAAELTNAKKGFVVNAEAEHLLRDISITGGVAVGGSAGVAVDATVVINKIGGDTTAAVNNTDVNKNIANLSTADVTVDAYDRADISSHIGTLSVGVGAGEGAGVGAAGAGDRNTVDRDTTARIVGKDDGSTVLNAQDVHVDALGYTSVYLSESGVAAGASALAGAGVTGSVSVDRFTSNTTALVSQVKGTVNDLIVYADRLANVETYNNAIALSGGIFSGSVSVGVTDVEDTSHTNAELSKVELAAANNQSGEVRVLAENHTQLGTELSGDALAVSIGGAAGIAVGNINTEAQVGAKVDNAIIGSEEKEFAEFTAEAKNYTYNRYQNIAVGAGSLLGVAVGKGAMNINTGTAVEVLNSSAFAKNINVNAFEDRTINTDMVGVGVGALNVGVNVMYTNIGTDMKSSYSYDDGSKSYDNSDFATMVNNALARMNSQVDVVRTKTGDNSIEYSSSTINTGRADQGGIRNTISNSALKASEDLKVQAKATTNTDIDIKQAAVAIVNIGVPANRTDVEDKLTIDIDNAALQGKTITVESITDGEIKSYTGQGGFTGVSYTDTTAYTKHHGTNKISIDGSTLNVVNAASTATNPLYIHAINQTQINNSALGVNIGLAVAGRLVLEGEDSTEVKVELGKDENVHEENVFRSTKLVDDKVVYTGVKALAENAAVIKNEIPANVGAGLVAAGGSIVTSKATGKATLDVSSKNAFEAQEVDLESLTGGTKTSDTNSKYTTEAINRAVGVSAVTINVDKARTYNNMQATTAVDAIRIIDQIGENKITPADLKIGATNATSSNAYIHSVDVGMGAASGSNFAQSHAEGKAITTVNAGDSGISANSFDIFASNSDDIIAKADGSNAGLMDISPYAARVENTVNTTTTVNLTGNFEAAGVFKARALRSDKENFSADALSVTIAGGGDARVDSTITANTNVNVSGAIINSGDDTILEAENTVEMNRKDGYAQMVKGQGYAVFGVNTSGIKNTINSTAHVNLINSKLQSGGDLKAFAHTEEQLQANGYVYTASAMGGVESRVTNNITNDEEVKVQNSNLKTTKVYKDITLSAADDLKLFTYAYSEFSTGAWGGADAIVKNNLTRNNKINLFSGSDLYSLQDVNLYAGKNADGSVATLDLDAEASDFVGSVLPITLKPTVTNNIQQNNQITVDASSASTSVRHTNLYASTGREMARTTSGRYVGIYYTNRDSKFVTTDKGETINGKTANNFVNINGSVIAGIANKIDITIGTAGDIVILDKDMRQSVAGAKNSGDITITVDANESTGLSKDSLTFGSENYANTLYERYNAILDLMNEYEKDGANSAVYLGYQVEANRILEEMLTLGLAERVPVKDSDPQNPTYVLEPKASLSVDYVEIPELVGSGGNITVDTDVFKSSGGTGVTKAQGTPVINITNNTNLMTKVNSIIVGDPGGKLVYNGQNVDGADTAAFNQSIKALNKDSAGAGFKTIEAADGESGVINIHGKYNGNSLNYSFTDETGSHTGSYRPMANIQIQGNIYSKEGTVTIKSDYDSILMQGKDVKDAVSVSGSTINIIAENGNITQGYTDGIVSIGGDVRQQYDAQYQQIIKNSVGQYTLSYVDTPIDDGSKGSGSYIAGGSVYINASDININGVIQSGFGDYYADISDANVQDRITQINNAYTGKAISDSVVTTGEQYKIIDGGAYWDGTAQCYKYRLNVYYNPSTQKILVQNVDAGGGRIYLTGRISSTGSGKIVCLDGVSNVNVNNTTSYDLQVGDLITHEVAGLVSITDTAQGKLTEITNGKVTVKDILAGGKISSTETSNDFTGSYNYAPQTGLRYTWTTGKEVTTFNRYSKDFKEGGWGMWDNGVDTEKLAEWTTTNNVQPIETGQKNNKDRAPGETIRLDTTAGNNSFVTVTHKKVTDKIVKESERKYSTGLWGINKHYVVTWTRTTGDLYTYDASVKADNPINIKFVGNNADSGNVNVTSINNIELTGTVGNKALYEAITNDVVTGRNEKGTVNITSQSGSLIQSGGALYGANINLSAAKDMTDITVIAGDTVNLSAVNSMSNQNAIAQNSIDVTVKGAYLAKGNVVLGNLGSVVTNNNANSVPVNASGVKTTGVTGLVEITTSGPEGNISQKAGSLIVADRIDLNSNNGSIYGHAQEDGSVTALQLYAGQQPIGLDTLDASVNASAKGDINLEMVDGNMRIGRIYATEGDVTLTVAHGSVEDALPYVSSDRGDADDMVARWKRLGIVDIAGSDADMLAAKNFQNQSAKKDAYEAWDTYALLYAVQDSIVNPETSALPSTSDKDPNIIGHNITINVADSVGMNSGIEKRIDTATLLDKDASGNYKNLDDLKALSKLDASTKVAWETGDNGHTYAVYTETIPIGIQQTTKIEATGQGTTVVNGKLTIQSAATSAASSNALHGDIFLQGREQKLANGEGTPITQNKDLFVNNILTNVGEINLTSLGGIYNAANAAETTITGKNMVLTAARGSIGTAVNHITTNLLGADKNVDGISAISSGGIYVDQKGSNGLIVRNVSSGGDIYLGSDQNIIMGVVNGTDAVNYIRAENNGDIVLEARGGSIGEPVNETDKDGNVLVDTNNKPIIYRDKNNGIRILNSATASSSANDTHVSNVVLRASDSVYLTGVASTDGKTAVAQGPAGTLNLTVASTNSNSSLKNVGIYVDGALNLENAVSASETASAYVTGDLKLDNGVSITAPDTYLGSGKDIIVNNVQNINGTDKLTIKADHDVLVNSGEFTSKVLFLQAGNDVQLNGGNLSGAQSLSMYAGNDLQQNGAVITAHNESNNARALLSASDKIMLTKGSLTADEAEMIAYAEHHDHSPNIVESYTEGAADNYQMSVTKLSLNGQGISLDSKLNQLQNVIVDRRSSGTVVIGNGNTTDADLNVSLGYTSESDVNKFRGSLTVHNYASGEANKIVVNQILGATGDIKLINDEANVEIVGSGSATNLVAANITLQSQYDVIHNGGTITATDKVFLEADGNILLQSGAMQTRNLDLLALGYIDEIYDNSIVDPRGYTLKVSDKLEALAGGSSDDTYGVDLGSRFNELHNVVLDSDNGNIIVGNSNKSGAELNVSVQSGQVVNGNILITNYQAGALNDINIQSALRATGKIKVVNEEQDVNVVSGAMVDATEVELYAAHDVNNTASIHSAEQVYLIAVNDINNAASITSGKNLILWSMVGDIKNEGTIQAVERIDMDATKGTVYNLAGITSTSGVVEVLAGESIVNLGDNESDAITAKGEVVLDAGEVLINTAKIISTDADVSIQANAGVMNIVARDYEGTGTTNQNGSIKAKGNVVIKTFDENIKDVSSVVYNSADIESDGNVIIDAYGSLYNDGNIKAVQEVHLDSWKADLHNTGDIVSVQGDVKLYANQNLYNGNEDSSGNITAKNQIELTAYKGNVVNYGVMEAVTGDISIISTDGVIFNESGADLLSGNGNVTLRAESTNGYYYYFDAQGVLHELTDASALKLNDYGEYVVQINDNTYYPAIKNGSVFNAGDIMAMGGTITLEAVKGNLTNYDDFNTLSTDNPNSFANTYKGKAIATGNIDFKAVNGHLYNAKDLESGENISLTAAEGLSNFAYNVYAGKNITLTATTGDVVNTAVLESVYGDVKLVAEHGNIINGKASDPSSGDIVTSGGKVILEVRGADGSGNGYNVTNYGDIIAIGKMTKLSVNNGTINASAVESNNTITLAGGTVKAVQVTAGKDINISGGTMNATNVNSGTTMDITGGIINAAHLVAGTTMTIAGGEINTGSGEGTLQATIINMNKGQVNGAKLTVTAKENFTQNGGSIEAKDAAINVSNNMQLNGGLLQADVVRLRSEHGNIAQQYDNSVNQANGGLVYAGDLYISGNNAGAQPTTVDLGGRFNHLSNVVVENGTTANITVGNGNDVDGTLTVRVGAAEAEAAGQLKGSLTVHNYVNGAANKLSVNDKLHATGDIKLINDEANVEIVGSGSATNLVAANITLQSQYDVIHNGGTITATDKVFLEADGNILLQSGAMQTRNLDLLALGYIDEIYDNSVVDPRGYTLKVSDKLEALAGGSANDAYGVDLGSKFNQLHNVILYSDNGNIILGNGNTDAVDLNVSVQSGHVVNGNIKITNYTAGEANDVNIKTALKAKGNIDVGNEEKDVNIQADTEVDGNRVILYAARNIKNYATIASLEETNLVAFKDIKNYADIVSEKNTVLASLAGDIRNEGDIQAANNIDIDALVGNIYNYADISSQNGSIDILAGKDLANLGDLSTGNGNLKLQAKEDVLNYGVMEAVTGDISIISTDGVIFNESGADLLSGNGNVTLKAASTDGYYYYFDNAGVLHGLGNSDVLTMNAKGEYVVKVGDVYYTALKNGSVFNAGDIMAMGGTITLEAVKGNLTNYDDFNTLSTDNPNSFDNTYKGKAIATGNIDFKAVNGHLYNDKDLESGENISLTAAQGLTNFAYNVYAGKNITLTATTGDVVNKAVLESVYGDVKLVAEHGNVVNGIENQPSSGDIITLGGKVILEARGADANGNGYSVTNYGDIIAIGKMTNDVEGSGSIILKSENGNVYNYDDFNTLNNGTDIQYTYDASKHISIVTTKASYNIATSNIDILAEKGEIVNDKDYLVALGNVTLKAQEGIGSYGDVILAGGDITLSDTDGNLVNRAQLVSVDGDITLNADKGTVVNMLDGDVVALNGNVTLHAGADYDDQVKYVGINGNTVVEGTVASVPEGRIIVTKKYYVLNGQETEMVNDVTVPQNATVKTVIGYLDEANNDTFVAVETVGYDVEAYRMGDVVNRGDLVALNPDNVDGKGSISLVTDHGNATNYDNFKLVDGAEQFAYLGKTGYAVGSNTVKFNEGTQYYYDKGMVLSDADLAMQAKNGYLYNTMNMHSEKSLTLISGKNMTIGTNFAAIDAVGDVTLQSVNGTLKVKDGSSVTSTAGSISMDGNKGVINSNSAAITAAEDIAMKSAAGAIENDSTVTAINGSIEMNGNNGITNNDGAAITAGQNVVMASEAGKITNASSVTAQKGSIVLDSQGTEAINGGITSNAAGSGLSALNGSISAVVKYGEINISELIAKDTAAAGTQSGNVTLGNIKGDDVVLYTESASSDITVNNITVGDHLLLQGNSFKHTDEAGNIVSGVGTITRSSNEGTLIVDVSGVGEAGGNGAMKSDFGMQVEGDVRFTTMNVTNANVSIGGVMSIDKLHVGGEAHFESQGYVTGVYGGGATPYHDTSNALYYDLGDGTGSTGLNMRVTADEFRAVPDEAGQLSALAKMKELKALMTQAGNAPDTFGKGDNGGWMNLYVDTANYQRSNGLLLHIDTGYRSANQRWSAEDLGGKLVDFKSHDSFVAHYGNMASFFDRFDLLEQPAQPMSEILHTANKDKVVLQQDNTTLRIEEEKKEE